MKVFVIDIDGTPLLPTRPKRARQLMKQGRARPIRINPFTIQLQRKVNNPVGNFTLGVDDGAKYVGFALKNNKTDEVVFAGEMQIRQDVSRKVGERAQYRRTRRSRKLRRRPARFSNRIRSRLAPSIKYRKDCTLRVIKDLSSIVPITDTIVEEVKFNHAKHRYGRRFSHVEIGKTYLKQQICAAGLSYTSTFGYTTKATRIQLGLPKKHYNDAISIVQGGGLNYGRPYYIKPRRTKIWEANPTKTCTTKNGFKHYDIIKAQHRTRGQVVGSIRSLKAKVITIRTKFDDNFPVSYKKSKLIERPGGLIYIY